MLVSPPSRNSGNLAQGLADLQRAVQAAGFYPPGHPHRSGTLQRAFEVFQGLLRSRPLLFTVSRRGFTLGGEQVEGSEMMLQLANDCVIRRIASIVLLQDLLLYDLEVLVRLLSSDPHHPDASVQQAGIAARTIWINERDVAAILAKRAGAGTGNGTGAAFGTDAAVARGADRPGEASAPATFTPASPRGGEEGSEQLLLRMAREKADASYQELGRRLLATLRCQPDRAAVLYSLEELLRQHREGHRSLPQREYAIFTFGQLADAAADFLLGSLESKLCQEKERIHLVLSALGGKAAYLIIERICVAKGLYERRSLAAALVAVGPAALAPLIAMLKDSRWYVVRNMVSVIGELGSPECVAELRRPLQHKDDRVRKEAIRALTRIGGDCAEAMLIQLLEESEELLVRRAIAALGQLKSRQAVPALLKLLERRDLFLKELPVKKELLAALAAIGDCSATARLLRLLESRGMPLLGRRLELKSAVASTLGQLGDETALPALARLASGSGAMAQACREALAAVEGFSGLNAN